MDIYSFDRGVESRCGCNLVGVDEAGRGPLAGPVVAAAVRLDLSRPILGVNDSKKLTRKKREELYERIVCDSIAWSVAEASPEEIDRLNILRASLLAMKRALDGIGVEWTLALIDGNRRVEGVPDERQQAVVGGDGKSASVAAASIIAKVTRDRIMEGYHEKFPDYDFHIHKGYPTLRHRDRILQHGICSIHRKSFCNKLVSRISLPLEIK